MDMGEPMDIDEMSPALMRQLVRLNFFSKSSPE